MTISWKQDQKTVFPTPVLRPMTAATVGTVSVPPVISRNSAIDAVPVRSFPIRKNPVIDIKVPIVTEKNPTFTLDLFLYKCRALFMILYSFLSEIPW